MTGLKGLCLLESLGIHDYEMGIASNITTVKKSEKFMLTNPFMYDRFWSIIFESYLDKNLNRENKISYNRRNLSKNMYDLLLAQLCLATGQRERQFKHGEIGYNQEYDRHQVTIGAQKVESLGQYSKSLKALIGYLKTYNHDNMPQPISVSNKLGCPSVYES